MHPGTDHCLDYLRQTMMCHGDTGLISFRIDAGDYQPVFNITRVCRKYDPLRDWAGQHRLGDFTPDGRLPLEHHEHV